MLPFSTMSRRARRYQVLTVGSFLVFRASSKAVIPPSAPSSGMFVYRLSTSILTGNDPSGCFPLSFSVAKIHSISLVSSTNESMLLNNCLAWWSTKALRCSVFAPLLLMIGLQGGIFPPGFMPL